jgi:hypothetical protein
MMDTNLCKLNVLVTKRLKKERVGGGVRMAMSAAWSEGSLIRSSLRT